MPQQYEQTAIETCRKLYCKFGGKNADAIEQAMRAAGYVGWKAQNLWNRGKGRNERVGWVERYGFDKSLSEYLKIQIEGVTDDVQKLYLEIKSARESVGAKVKSGTASSQEITAHVNYCRLEMDARTRLDLQKDSYEAFVAVFEKFLMWLPDISESAAVALLSGDAAERLLARARAEYGEQEIKSDG